MARRFVVVATQGKGDKAALHAIIEINADYKAFVGSRRKMASIHEKLIATGASEETFDAIKAPAGVDIGTISPKEIALSIFAKITATRRKTVRSENT